MHALQNAGATAKFLAVDGALAVAEQLGINDSPALVRPTLASPGRAPT